jgi:hypothetical protein
VQSTEEVIRGHSRPFEVIRGHSRSFEVIRGHSSPQAQSHLVLPREEGKGLDIEGRVELYHEEGAVARRAKERVVLEYLWELLRGH